MLLWHGGSEDWEPEEGVGETDRVGEAVGADLANAVNAAATNGNEVDGVPSVGFCFDSLRPRFRSV